MTRRINAAELSITQKRERIKLIAYKEVAAI